MGGGGNRIHVLHLVVV